MKHSTHNANRFLRRRDPRRRRGMSLLVVILFVSVATVVSYALLRGESTAMRIQENADLRDAARHAALSGLSYGVHAIHFNDWEGVGTNQTRALAAHQRFTVSFAAGDPSLQSGAADYADYAYRVTIQSTGYAEDPKDANRVASHTVRAVVRLVPRALSTWTNWANDGSTQPAWPTDWYRMEGFSIYQTREENVSLNMPCRLQGNMRFQKKVYLGKDEANNNTYPTCSSPVASSPWYYYLLGLRLMSQSGGVEYRPIVTPKSTDKVHLPYYEQDSTYRDFIARAQSALSFSWNRNASSDNAASDWTRPTGLSTYQIYPGGPVYDVATLSGNQQDVSLGPDPVTNPLGLFYHNSTFTMQGNVSVRGTLFCNGDMTQSGTATFQPVDLPALYGSDRPVRLPALTANRVLVESGSTTNITGLVATFERLEILESSAAISFSLTGRLVTDRLYVRPQAPDPWDQLSPTSWALLLSLWQSSAPSTPFPQWLSYSGLDPTPQVKFAPDSTSVLYHWNDWTCPVYAPHDDDGGLRWEMLEWSERVN